MKWSRHIYNEVNKKKGENKIDRPTLQEGNETRIPGDYQIYADDTKIKTTSDAQINKKLQCYTNVAEPRGLELQWKKTIIINNRRHKIQLDNKFEGVKTEKKGTYLGIILRHDGKITDTAKDRLKKGRGASNKMKNKIFRDPKIATSLKIRIWDATIKPILCYGLHTFEYNSKNTKEIQKFANKCHRFIIAHGKKDTKTTKQTVILRENITKKTSLHGLIENE